MGRPSFNPTDQQRAQVATWVAARVPVQAMAARLGLAPKTFRKHFAAELGTVPMAVVDAGIESTRSPAPAVLGAFRPTSELREAVLIMAGAKFSHAEIARKVGVGVPVLREHFTDELERGPVIYKSDIITSLYFAAKGGNVAAAKVCLLFNGSGEPDGDADAPGAPIDQPTPHGLQGKKANAALEAQSAEKGTPFDRLLN